MEEARALKELKQDKSRSFWEQRDAMVVLDKEDYTKKAQDLLAQRDTYIPYQQTVKQTHQHI